MSSCQGCQVQKCCPLVLGPQPRTISSYRVTVTQRDRLYDLRRKVTTHFQPSDSDHKRALVSLAAATIGELAPDELVTPRWKLLGFQGLDPSTDLRSAGLFGLQNLVYFVHTHRDAFFRMCPELRASLLMAEVESEMAAGEQKAPVLPSTALARKRSHDATADVGVLAVRPPSSSSSRPGRQGMEEGAEGEEEEREQARKRRERERVRQQPYSAAEIAAAERAARQLPFALVGLNLTHLLAHLLCCNRAFRELLLPEEQPIFEAFLHLIGEDPHVFEEIYCAAFLYIEEAWTGYMEAPLALARTRLHVRQCLLRRPENIADFQRFMAENNEEELDRLLRTDPQVGPETRAILWREECIQEKGRRRHSLAIGLACS